MLLFQQMVVLFIYMMIGYVSCKKGKLDEAFGKKYILTIRGVGYYVKEE